MSGRFRLRPAAARDLVAIRRYIALDNPRAAVGLLGQLLRTFQLLADAPRAGRLRNPRTGLRTYPVGAYQILYRACPGGAEIARVVHGARDLRALLRG